MVAGYCAGDNANLQEGRNDGRPLLRQFRRQGDRQLRAEVARIRIRMGRSARSGRRRLFDSAVIVSRDE